MNWLKESPSFTFDPLWPWSSAGFGLPLLAVVGLVLVVLTVWTYSGSRRIGQRRLSAIIALRLGALLLALFVLVRPSVVSHDPGHPASSLLIVADVSGSMTSQDEFDGQSRWDYLRRLIKEARPRFETLQMEQNVSVNLYAFAEDLRD